MWLKVVIFSILFLEFSYGYSVPNCHFVARYPAGLRIYMPDSPGMQSFSFRGNQGIPLESYPNGMISRYTTTKVNGYWLLEDPYIPMNVGQTLHYTTVVNHRGTDYVRRNQTWTCRRLYNKYPENPPWRETYSKPAPSQFFPLPAIQFPQPGNQPSFQQPPYPGFPAQNPYTPPLIDRFGPVAPTEAPTPNNTDEITDSNTQESTPNVEETTQEETTTTSTTTTTPKPTTRKPKPTTKKPARPKPKRTTTTTTTTTTEQTTTPEETTDELTSDYEETTEEETTTTTTTTPKPTTRKPKPTRKLKKTTPRRTTTTTTTEKTTTPEETTPMTDESTPPNEETTLEQTTTTTPKPTTRKPSKTTPKSTKTTTKKTTTTRKATTPKASQTKPTSTTTSPETPLINDRFGGSPSTVPEETPEPTAEDSESPSEETATETSTTVKPKKSTPKPSRTTPKKKPSTSPKTPSKETTDDTANTPTTANPNENTIQQDPNTKPVDSTSDASTDDSTPTANTDKQNTLMDMLTESTPIDSTTSESPARKRETPPSDDLTYRMGKQVTPFPHHDPDAEWTTPTSKPTPPPSTTKNPNPSPEDTTVDPTASFPDHPAYNPIPIFSPPTPLECMDLPNDTEASEVEKKLAKVNCELKASQQSMTQLIQEFNKRLMTISKINIDLKNRMDRIESVLRTKSFS